uniref:DNA polymerase delta catalytic subunit n=2 Tax=Physcomitrium patens TaxID=3218 RepID=A0A7I4AID5_PHYPA
MQSNEFILIVILYVDDLIILTNTMKMMDWLKVKLERDYEMSNLGELHYYLGVEFVRDCAKKTITMSQNKYIEEMLKRFKMEECKPIRIPLEANLKLMELMDEKFAEVESKGNKEYKEVTIMASRIYLEYTCSWNAIQVIDQIDVPRPLIMCMDIEVYSSNASAMPDPCIKKDRLFMISVASQRYLMPNTSKKYILYTGQCNIDVDEMDTRTFSTERNLIEAYFLLIKEINLDVIIGYNIFMFDFEYIDIRLQRKLINLPSSSRVQGIGTERIDINWNSSAYRFNNYVIIDLPRHTVIDVYQYVTKEYKLQSYSLSSVSEKFTRNKKIDLPYKEVFNLYVKGDKESIETIARYCIVDSLLTIALFDNMNICVSVTKMATVARTRIRDLYTRGQQIRVKSQLYKECYDKGIVFDKTDSLLEEFEYEGAIVSNPTLGLYKWCSLLDFSSLYPSVIISHNICYSTFIRRNSNQPYFIVQVSDKKSYMFAKEPLELVPSLLKTLILKRKKVKIQSSTTIGIEKVVLQKRQLALKISTNYFIEGAESTTAIGRSMLMHASSTISSRYLVQLVYGDIDSCMFTSDAAQSYESCKVLAICISNEVSKEFPVPVKLEFEAVFETFLLITKKRYVRLIAGEYKMIYKGVVVSRRDSCIFLKHMYSSVVEMIMNSSSHKYIMEFVRAELLSLVRGHIPLESLVITKTLGKDILVLPGDKLDFVFVKTKEGFKLQGYKMCPPHLVLPHNLEIDYLYYIETHISNPIDQILQLLGQKSLALTSTAIFMRSILYKGTLCIKRDNNIEIPSGDMIVLVL